MDARDLRELQVEIERLKARLARVEDRTAARSSRRLPGIVASRRARICLGAAVVLGAAASYAATISVPYKFVNGTIADADEVNANFDVLEMESNDQDARIGALEASQSDGTVTLVDTGGGLTGGPITATGTISVATDGIDASHIGAGAVGRSEIAALAVGSDEIDEDAVDSNHIASNAVGSSEIAPGAVGSSQIAADAVGSSEIASDAVTLDEIDVYLAQDSILLSAGESEAVSVACDAGYLAISGTWRQIGAGGPQLRNVNNWNNGNPTFVGGGTWSFGFWNPSSSDVDVNVGVWCFRSQ